MASYTRNKARKSTRPFLSLDKGALKSPHFRSLTGNETKVFLHLYGEYNGSNNGYLALPYYAVTIEPVDEVIKNGVSVHDLRPTKTASHKWRNCLAK